MREPDPGVTAAACRYLLVALLPRLEELRPGIVTEVRAGIAADRDAMAVAGALSPAVDTVVAEALRILQLAAAS